MVADMLEKVFHIIKFFNNNPSWSAMQGCSNNVVIEQMQQGITNEKDSMSGPNREP